MKIKPTNIVKMLLLINHFCLFIKSYERKPLNNNYNRHLESTFENFLSFIINGPGQNIRIIGSSFNFLPNEIYINNSPAEIKKKVNITEEVKI